MLTTRTTNDDGAGPLSVEYLPPQALQPYPNNARGHSKRQLTKLAASIAEYGFVVPVLIDGGNGLIAGHARVEAATSLGLDAIPCIRIDISARPRSGPLSSPTTGSPNWQTGIRSF